MLCMFFMIFIIQTLKNVLLLKGKLQYAINCCTLFSCNALHSTEYLCVNFIVYFQQKISQVENDNLAKTRQLEEQLKNEKERYKMDIENLQKELRDIKQRRSQNKSGEASVRTEKERKYTTDCISKASQVIIFQKCAIATKIYLKNNKIMTVLFHRLMLFTTGRGFLCRRFPTRRRTTKS